MLHYKKAWVGGHWLDNLKRNKPSESAPPKDFENSFSLIVSPLISSYDPLPNQSIETEEEE